MTFRVEIHPALREPHELYRHRGLARSHSESKMLSNIG